MRLAEKIADNIDGNMKDVFPITTTTTIRAVGF